MLSSEGWDIENFIICLEETEKLQGFQQPHRDTKAEIGLFLKAFGLETHESLRKAR